MRKAVPVAILLSALAACEDAPPRRPAGVTSRYRPGQVWTYDTRDGEAASRARVVKVENHERLGVLVHVFLDGLKIPNPRAEGEADARIPVIAHLPLLEKAMDASVRRLVGENQPLPHHERAYLGWKRAFLAGEVGVFEVSIRAAVDHVHKARQAEH